MMFATAVKVLAGTRGQRGFTLIELLIVILIVGILAAVGVPLYLGYTKDAKLAEGKALAGSALTAFQACAAYKGSTGNCTLAEVYTRIGVDSTTGETGDKRWSIAPSSTITINADNTYSGTIGVSGKASDNSDLSAALFATSTGIVLRCNLNSGTPPASETDGDPC